MFCSSANSARGVVQPGDPRWNLAQSHVLRRRDRTGGMKRTSIPYNHASHSLNAQFWHTGNVGDMFRGTINLTSSSWLWTRQDDFKVFRISELSSVSHHCINAVWVRETWEINLYVSSSTQDWARYTYLLIRRTKSSMTIFITVVSFIRFITLVQLHAN